MHARFTIATMVIAALSLAAPASAQDPAAAPPAEQSSPCIAIVLPSVQGTEGSASDVAAGARDLLASYLTGPTIRSVAVEARLASQALEEAKIKQCTHLLVTTLTFKRDKGSGVGRALGRAARDAAWYMPGSSTARSAAIVGTQAAASVAETTKSKDEITLQVKLTAIGTNRVLLDKTDKRKAGSDGEDLMTPLVERAAQAIYDAAMKK